MPELKECNTLPALLIAENNITNYQLLEAMLRKEYQILHARNGSEAVELFVTRRPAFVLISLGLRNPDGYATASDIRRLSDRVPIVALTSYSLSPEELHVGKCGFNDFVPNPVRISVLREKLRRLSGV